MNQEKEHGHTFQEKADVLFSRTCVELDERSNAFAVTASQNFHCNEVVFKSNEVRAASKCPVHLYSRYSGEEQERLNGIVHILRHFSERGH